MLFQYGKRRRVERHFVLEGVRLVRDALASNVRLEFILFRAEATTDTVAAEILQQADSLAIPCLEVEEKLFNQLTDTPSPQGVLAVSPFPELPLPENPTLVLILSSIADPGNLGTILRTAAAVGVDYVILTPRSVDPFNPKAVRGAMGAHFRIPIEQWSWEQIREINLPLLVADAGGSNDIYATDFSSAVAIVIGSEAHGPDEQLLSISNRVISIPMTSGESLNAAMAGSIILYEIYRQRHYR
jgi:TrmH family RNA methyltransferase